jgi:hypothetical protein
MMMTDREMTEREKALIARRAELQAIVAAGRDAEAELKAIAAEIDKADPTRMTRMMALVGQRMAEARDKRTREAREAKKEPRR